MSRDLSRFSLLLLLLLLGGSILAPGKAHAGIYCAITNTPMSLSFGDVSVSGPSGSASAVQLNYQCTSYSPAETFTPCATGPTSDNIGSYTRPVMLLQSGSYDAPKLLFNFYTDSSRTLPWSTTQFDAGSPVSMAASSGGSAVVTTGIITIYAYIPGGQTSVLAGNYAATLYGINLGFVSGGQCLSSTGDLSAYTGASINVSARVGNNCTVSAGASLDLGTVDPTASNISGNNTISVNCPAGTAYYVGLAPSNGNLAGAGLMQGTGSNTDKVPYQLRSTAGSAGVIWGNTASRTSVGNGVAGTGTGLTRSLTVYATVNNANYTPGTYSDTVTINVYY